MIAPVIALAIVVGALLLAGLLAGAIVRFVRGRAHRVDARAAEDLADAILGPERRVLYMGGTGPFPRASGNGRLTLTSTRLAFRGVLVADVIVPVADIVEVRPETKGWHTRPVARKPYVEVVTAAGKVAIAVRDATEWIGALDSARAHANRRA
jgi:hypothetical protein